MGGNAELELVDSMDPFSEGIIFSVMPPKKSWKNISNLSGGEKVGIHHQTGVEAAKVRLVDSKFSRPRIRIACIQGMQLRASVLVSDAFISQHHCTSWMRLMLRWTSEMFPSSQTILKIGQRTPNSSSFHYGK